MRLRPSSTTLRTITLTITASKTLVLLLAGEVLAAVAPSKEKLAVELEVFPTTEGRRGPGVPTLQKIEKPHNYKHETDVLNK